MSPVRGSIRRWAAAAALVLLAGCGGGGSAEVVVIAQPVPVAGLGIVLSRIGPETIQIDWSDDRFVDVFTVRRDGGILANVRSTALIDDSVVFDRSYCYAVDGYDRAGNLVAASPTACITLFP